MDCTGITAAKALVDNVLLKFAIPELLTSDNGSAFIDEILREVTKLLKIKRILTTPYNPKANIVERFHKTLGAYLRAFTQKEPNHWHELLPFALFAYNYTVHTSTEFTPNELMFGSSIQIPTAILENKVPIYNYDNFRSFCVSDCMILTN